MQINATTQLAVVQWSDGTYSDTPATTTPLAWVSTDGIPWISGITPAVGETVMVDIVAGSPMIIGAVRTAVSTTNTVVAATVATLQTTTSTVYTTLGGPTATITLTAGQNVLVTVAAIMSMNTLNQSVNSSWAITGAQTVASANANRISTQSATGVSLQRTALYNAPVSGSYNFVMQYFVSGGTGTVQERTITVLAL